MLSYEQVLKEVSTIFVSFLEIQKEQITEQSTMEELGAKSLVLIELIMKIEENFDIQINTTELFSGFKKDKLLTVNRLCTRILSECHAKTAP